MSKISLIHNRPISPHLLVYVPQISSLFSIWHRITGVLLASFVSFYFLFFKLFTIINYTQLKILHNIILIVHGVVGLTNYLYLIISILILYHMLNGIRHIIWDVGFFLNIRALFFSSLIFLIILLIVVLDALV